MIICDETIMKLMRTHHKHAKLHSCLNKLNLTLNISMVSGTNHSSLDRHFFQNDDKNDKTHRAQNVYLSRPT